MKKTIHWKTLLPYGIALVALIVGSFYDYALTDMLHGSFPWLGIFFERLILIPVESMVMITFVMLSLVKHKKWYLLLGYVASWYIVQDALHYWFVIGEAYMTVGVALLALGYLMLFVVLLKRMDRHMLKERLPFFIFFTCVLLTSAFCTTMLKQFWGRIRYRDMETISQFTAWFQLNGFTGNHSFPSGHTTGFTAILCFLEWRRNRYAKRAWWIPLLLWLLVLLMPLSRMMMGAHFLSDTAVGFMITYSWYLIYRHTFRKRGYL